MAHSFCKYCERLVPSKQIVVKTETYTTNGKTETYAWVGCKDCWDNLQKVA